jgi:predicted TIM-barrel fold metal-dependent hydrolase
MKSSLSMKRGIVLAACAGCFGSSCVIRPIVLPPIPDSPSGLKQVEVEREFRLRDQRWLAVGGQPRPVVVDIPIIDIHAHGFNAEALPADQIIKVRAGEVLNVLHVHKGTTWLWGLGNGLRYGLLNASAVLPGLHKPLEKSGWAGDPINTRSIALFAAALTAGICESPEELTQLKNRYSRRLNPVASGENRSRKQDLGFCWLVDHARQLGLFNGEDAGFVPSQTVLDQMARVRWKQENGGREPGAKDLKAISKIRAQMLIGEIENTAYLGARLMLDENIAAWKHQLSPYQLLTFELRRLRTQILGSREEADDYVAERAVRNASSWASLLNSVISHGHGTASAVSPECSGGGPPFQPHRSGMRGAEPVLWLLVHLSRPWQRVPEAYLKGDAPQMELIIQHMMAMNNAMNQQPGPVLAGLQRPVLIETTEQAERMAQIQTKTQGKAAYFVAWDPFVSKNEAATNAARWRLGLKAQGTLPEALRRVEHALESEGAMGVKFYPPMGYRPTDNGCDFGGGDRGPFDSKPAWPLDRKAKRDAWAARYAGTPGWDAEALDALNDLLFEFCTSRGIPLFTHCNDGEMAASGGYGRFAHPRAWSTVLQKHRNLRICFGHAGGNDFWFESAPAGNENRSNHEWGKMVLELCRCYPNAFCEIGIHSEIVDPGFAARFAVKVDGLLAAEAQAGGWPLSQKMMYGTDWPMPIHETTVDYLRSYLEVWEASPLLRQHKQAFFAGNAARYLRLADHVAGQLSFGPKGASRARFSRLLERLPSR